MSGIFLSYDIMVHIPFIYLSYKYDTNLFSNKTQAEFLSYPVGIWHPCKIPKHTMSLYLRGDYFLKSYFVLKKVNVYDKYKPSIFMVYDKISHMKC